eukprot:scaffold28204_cov42-Attheya_sp.AAC.4
MKLWKGVMVPYGTDSIYRIARDSRLATHSLNRCRGEFCRGPMCNILRNGVGQETPGPSRGELKKVLKVAGHSPKSRGQQEGGFDARLSRGAVHNRVGGRNVFGFLAPYQGLALGRPKDIPLPIRHIIKDDPRNAQCKQGQCHGKVQARRILDQEAGVK